MLPREALEVLTEAQELPVGGGFGVAVGEVCLRASEDNVEDFSVTAQLFEKHQPNVNVLSIFVTNRSMCDGSSTLIVTVNLTTVR